MPVSCFVRLRSAHRSIRCPTGIFSYGGDFLCGAERRQQTVGSAGKHSSNRAGTGQADKKSNSRADREELFDFVRFTAYSQPTGFPERCPQCRFERENFSSENLSLFIIKNIAYYYCLSKGKIPSHCMDKM